MEKKIKEDFKNNEWEVYVADENGREKIVKVAKSKRAGVILYNKLIKTDKYHEVGMRVIKEGKLTEKVKPKQKISKKEWSKIKKFNKHIGQDGTHYVTQLDKRLGTILVPVMVEGKLTEGFKKIAKKNVKYKDKYGTWNWSIESGIDTDVMGGNTPKIILSYQLVDEEDFPSSGGNFFWLKEKDGTPYTPQKAKALVNKISNKKIGDFHRKSTKPSGSGNLIVMKGNKFIREGKLTENKIYSKSDGSKIVKSVSKKGKVYKVDKHKTKYGGKNITMYALYTKYKNHTTGQNPFGLDMARNSKGEAMYLVPIKEGKITEKVSLSLIKKAHKAVLKGKDVVVYDQRGKKYSFQNIAGKSGGTIAVTDYHGKESSWRTLPHSLIKKIVIEGKLNEAKETIFDVAAKVMKDSQMYTYKSKKGMVKVDMQTANLLTKVFKKVNPKMKKILSDLGEKNPAQLVQTLQAVVK